MPWGAIMRTIYVYKFLLTQDNLKSGKQMKLSYFQESYRGKKSCLYLQKPLLPPDMQCIKLY